MKQKNSIMREVIALICMFSLITACFSGFSTESKAAPVEKDGYMTYTFSDLGFQEGELTTGETKTWDIESYDKVAFTGKITLGENDANTSINIGGNAGMHIYYSATLAGGGLDVRTLVFHDYSGNNRVQIVYNGEAEFAQFEEIQLTLKFDEIDETTMQLTVEVASGDKSYEKTFEMSTDLNKEIELVVQPGYSMTIESVQTGGSDPEEPENPEEPVYTTYTFSDLGFQEGELTTGETKPWDIDSWDKVAFTGKITLGENDANTSVNIGGTAGMHIYYSATLAGGGLDTRTLVFHDYSGNNRVQIVYNGEAEFAQFEEIQLTLKFDEIDETTMQLTVEVASGDKSYEKTFEMSTDLNKEIELVVQPGYSMTIESVQTGGSDPEEPENPEEPVYTTYTFSDLGFKEGQLITGETTTWNIESYDNVAFTGKVAFGENNINTQISIGGANGLHIFYSKNQPYFGENSLAFWDYSGSGLVAWISNEEAGFDLSKEIQLTLKFDVVEETKIQLTAEVASGDKSYEKTFPYAANAGMSKSIELVVQPGYVLKIESISDDPENPEEQVQQGPYTEYTFTDFGIYKSTYDSFLVKSWNIEKLDKVAFTGLVTFFEGDDPSGIYFAPSAGNWSGVIVRKYGDSLLIESYIGGGNLLIPAYAFGVEQLAGTEIKIRLAFDEIGDNVRMTVTVNDMITTYQDYQAEQMHELKTFVLRATETTPIAVASVGGTRVDRDIIAAWKNFLISPVKLEYFGFSTNNWKNEFKKYF